MSDAGQSNGGAFALNLDYTVTGDWVFSGDVTFEGTIAGAVPTGWTWTNFELAGVTSYPGSDVDIAVNNTSNVAGSSAIIKAGAGTGLTLIGLTSHLDSDGPNELTSLNSGGLLMNVNGNIDIAGSPLQGEEIAEPAAPAANGYVMFAKDNGAGKTQLMVRFSSGDSQQIAIQP